jgi:hypothetical protein
MGSAVLDAPIENVVARKLMEDVWDMERRKPVGDSPAPKTNGF